MIKQSITNPRSYFIRYSSFYLLSNMTCYDVSSMYIYFQFETSHMPGFEDLRPFVRSEYGFELECIKTLDGAEWLSWLVKDVSASQEGHCPKYVLKIGGVDDRDIGTELQWRQAMMKHFGDNGIVCSAVVPATSGQLHCSYKTDDGGKTEEWAHVEESPCDLTARYRTRIIVTKLGSHGILNTFRPRQNGRHFPDDIFKCIFFNENLWFRINISLKFVPRGRIYNVPIMAWRRPGDKPLSEPMMVRLLTHACVARPQCVNDSNNSDCMNRKHTPGSLKWIKQVTHN